MFFLSILKSRTFMITFGITIVLMGAIVDGAYATFRAVVRQPYIPLEVEFTRPVMSTPMPIRDVDNATNAEEPDDPIIEDDIEEPVFILTRRPDFYTLLVAGRDIGNNIDTIMVASFNAATGEMNLISIPRDTRIYGNRRTNKPVASYAYGRANGGGHEGGIAQLKADMHNLLGFPIDFYVFVDFNGFIRLVNAVGGVTVNVPFHMRYDDPMQNLHIDIPAGRQHLNGHNALHFVRFRQSNPGFRSLTDYGRIQNQHTVLTTVMASLLTPRTVLRLPEMINIYSTHVRTDLTIPYKLWFATQAAGLSASDFNTYTLPTTGTSGAPRWYELPDKDAILELVNRTINPFTTPITPDMVRIVQ